ncbi:hypothetical protein OIV83_005908 [Microbotryomycetes sp. JL201]|nr:hypothetical protein OIV83_005908 [Microbotryomycetes sp. JL201]
MEKSNIVDYSIFFDHVHFMLIGTFKYIGNDWDSDMAKSAEDPETRKWWQMTDSMQESFIEGAKGSADGPWWLPLREVFRYDGKVE